MVILGKKQAHFKLYRHFFLITFGEFYGILLYVSRQREQNNSPTGTDKKLSYELSVINLFSLLQCHVRNKLKEVLIFCLEATQNTLKIVTALYPDIFSAVSRMVVLLKNTSRSFDCLHLFYSMIAIFWRKKAKKKKS